MKKTQKLKDSFIFYRSYFESIKELPDEDRLRLYDSISEYSLNQQLPELKGISNAIFILIKPQIEANHKRYISGTKGGRPKKETETKPKYNQKETETKPNVNDNVNVECLMYNVNDNGKEYYICGGVVKLTEKDFRAWQKAFPNIDLKQELQRLDLEYQIKEPDNWFITTSQKLNYQNKNTKSESKPERSW